MKILVLGGYGSFGSRIVERLACDPFVSEVIIGGRSSSAALKLAALLDARKSTTAQLRGAAVDANDRQALRECLHKTKADMCVHTAGPWHDTRVAETCIASQVHYVDIADNRAFVAGFEARLDAQAKQQGVVAVAGASSVPGLSSSALQHLVEQCGVSSPTRVEMAISPGNRTVRGPAVVESIMSYCGKLMPVWRNGKLDAAYGWSEVRAHAFPGFGPRLLALCDVPDTDLLHRAFPTLRDVKFGAGVELSVMQLGAVAMGLVARAGLVQNWSRYAQALTRASLLFWPFGSVDGGMYVRVSNDAGATAQWDIMAGDGDGPQIPSTGAVLVCRQMARQSARSGEAPFTASGKPLSAGAHTSVGLFPLRVYEEEMSEYDVSTHIARGTDGDVADSRDADEAVYVKVEPGTTRLERFMLKYLLHLPIESPFYVEHQSDAGETVRLRSLLMALWGDDRATRGTLVGRHALRQVSRQTTVAHGSVAYTTYTCDGYTMEQQWRALATGSTTRPSLGLRREVTRVWLCGLPLPKALTPRLRWYDNGKIFCGERGIARAIPSSQLEAHATIK